MTFAASVVVVLALLGIALTLLTLPGIWVAIAGTILIKTLWQPGLIEWWTIGTAVGVGLLAEIADFAASAVGASKAGGTRHGALWSIVGGLVGAIAGSVLLPIPLVGTIVGAVVGAGLGAVFGEMKFANKPWCDAARCGRGAAIGRFASTIIKTGCAFVVAGLLIAGSVFAWA